MTQVFDDAPLSWMYETVYTDSNSPLVFSGAYDIYYDIWVAQIWNARILFLFATFQASLPHCLGEYSISNGLVTYNYVADFF
jgi:hypothetical protein